MCGKHKQTNLGIKRVERNIEKSSLELEINGSMYIAGVQERLRNVLLAYQFAYTRALILNSP